MIKILTIILDIFLISLFGNEKNAKDILKIFIIVNGNKYLIL